MAFMPCHAVQEQLEHESREMLLFLPSPYLVLIMTSSLGSKDSGMHITTNKRAACPGRHKREPERSLLSCGSASMTSDQWGRTQPWADGSECYKKAG